MDDRDDLEPNNTLDEPIGDSYKKAAQNFDTSAAPWVTGFLVLAVIVIGVLFFGPWDKPTQTTSKSPAPTQSAPP